jgi:long-subunit fatty acid transport protein
LKYLITSLLFCCSFFSFSQTEDAHVWTGAGLSYKISNKLSLGYETQTRFYKNASTLRVYLNQIGASYKITDDFKIGLDYRFSRKKKNYYFVSDNRFMLNASYGYKIKPLNTKFSIRGRFQHSFDRLNTINSVITPNFSNTARVKLSAKYKFPNFKRVSPFVSYEYFKSLDQENIIFFSSANRLSGGLNLDLPKKHEVKLAYIYQTSNGSAIDIRHIYSIQYTYNLEKLFNK